MISFTIDYNPNISPEEQLFISNISLLLKHRKEILTSPEMSGVITGVSNGMTFLGELRPITVGAYLDWWENSPNLSHDQKGRLIVKIRCSQLSKMHTCLAIDDAGNTDLAEIQDNLVDIVRSLIASTRKYPASKMTIEGLLKTLE